MVYKELKYSPALTDAFEYDKTNDNLFQSFDHDDY